jgi:crotonobetainyl-CoA:carnitine CoA-transferase CaiB-like acyl-CoA transferase
MRVIEISDREEAAAYAGKLLSRWGAEVVKVESPDRQPPLDAEDRYLNAGKQRIDLDLFDSDGRGQLDELLVGADILLTDRAPRDVQALDLLSEDASGPLVRMSISPFGLTGPYRDYEATASTLLALGGYTFLSGDIGRAPLTFPGKYPYYQAGTYAYTTALASYLHGLDGGTPTAIDVSVLETVTTAHQFTDVMWTHAGKIRSRHGNRWENLCPTTMFEIGDGFAALNIIPSFWEPFTYLMGRPDLATAEGWATNAERMERCDEVVELMTSVFADWSRERFLREAQETWRTPVGVVLNLDELLSNEHLAARGFWRPIEGDEEVRTPGSPFQFVDDQPPIERVSQPRASQTVAALPAHERLKAPSIVTGRDPRRPLEGVRVVDFTRIWSGPLAARILGDLGAEVIKIEAPTGRGPAVVPPGAGGNYPDGDPGDHPWNRQGMSNKLNRNKKSVAIDLKTEAGRAAVLELVAHSDVVIENFSARAMPSLKLDYQYLREANPNIIYLAMPAFGLYGPYRDYVGLGPSIEPLTGMTAFMGYAPDEPRMSVQALTDAMAGTAAASAVLTALERRARLGTGSFLEISQEEAGTIYFGEQMLEYQLTGDVPQRYGNHHPRFSPHGVYRCQGEDEWIALAVCDETQWRALSDLAGDGWQGRPEFATLEARKANEDALDQAIDDWTRGRDKVALMHELQAHGIAAGTVNSAPEWLTEPHLQDRGYFFEVDELDAGRRSYDGSPVTFGGDRGYALWSRAPGFGEHNSAILEGAAELDPAAVGELAAAGVIVDRPPA